MLNPRRHRPFRILPRHGRELVRPLVTFRPWLSQSLAEKNERVALCETKWFLYKLKLLGQPVTSEVRSGQVPKGDENPWSPITLLLMELEQNFNACSSRRDTFQCFLMPMDYFQGSKIRKIIFGSYDVIDLWWPGGFMTSIQVILV